MSTAPRVGEREAVERLRDFVDSLALDSLALDDSRAQEDRPWHEPPGGPAPLAARRSRGLADDLLGDRADDLHGSTTRHGRRRAGSAARPVVAAVAATLLLLATVFGGMRMLGPSPQPATGSQVVLPTQLPSYRHFPLPLSWSPVDRVLLSFQHGGDYEFFDRERSVVIAPDGTTVRRFATPEGRAALGGHAPTLVSPDGRRIAVGTAGWSGDVVVVDVDTAAEHVVRLTDAPYRAADPVAWSRDGATLYVRDVDASGDNLRNPGYLLAVDVPAGRVRPVPGVPHSPDVRTAMTGPDGQLLVSRARGIQRLDARGRVLRTYPAGPEDAADQNAWSPDGRYLASVLRGVQVLDLGTGRTRAIDIPFASRGLAWSDDRTYVVEEKVPQGSSVNSRLVEVDVVTGARWVVSSWGDTMTGAAVMALSVAADLVRHWQVQRQPWAQPAPGF